MISQELSDKLLKMTQQAEQVGRAKLENLTSLDDVAPAWDAIKKAAPWLDCVGNPFMDAVNGQRHALASVKQLMDLPDWPSRVLLTRISMILMRLERLTEDKLAGLDW